jgi:predicted Zn finger-like uncharacterized protein
MADTKITRCPYCQTTFRIRTEQLSVAKGEVRCGSCLQVFKASENLVLEFNKMDKAPIDATIPVIKTTVITIENPATSKITDSDISQPASKPQVSISKSSKIEPSFSEPSLSEPSLSESSSQPNEATTQIKNTNNENEEINDLILKTEEPAEIELSITNSVNDLHDEPLVLDNPQQKNTPRNKKPESSSHISQTTSPLTWFWFGASFIMILAIATQIIYFKFNDWSQDPDYRPFYALSCQVFGCELPILHDLSQMNTEHFTVRPHPNVKDALSIDTLLTNNADYPQPFPNLNIIFTDIDDKTIASRIFIPKEYLAGELTGATLMPKKVPIHIAFEIVNPGQEAVSYQIKLI